MENFFYNLGQLFIMIVPLVIALFCANRIRKNRAKIKEMEKEEQNKK